MIDEMDAVTKWCPRCKRELVETAWAPSAWLVRGRPCRECRDAYWTAYRATSEYKAKDAARRATLGYKAKKAAQDATPEAKATRAARAATPGAKAKRAARRASPKGKAEVADYHQRRKYGISLAEKQALIESQGGVCALCGKPFEVGQVPHTDHDHVTGVVRGVLHQTCNTALGLLGDDLVSVLNAVRYLSRSL